MYHEVVDGLRSFVESLDQRKTPRIEMLAAKYAALCDDANLRLSQCSELLGRGLRGEAIQLAEAEPTLLPMIGALDFPGRDTWVELAGLYDLPSPAALRIEEAAALNAAFAAHAPLENLLAKHRRLALARAPIEERLANLREIARLDPEPTAWDDERRAYERVWFSQCLERSREHAAAKRTRQVLATLMELQTAPHVEKPPAKLVQDMQKLVRRSATGESADVAEELERLQAAGDYDRVRRTLNRWQEVVELSGGAIDASVGQRASAVAAWLEAHDRFVAKEREFESALTGLQSRLMDPQASADDIEAAHRKTFGTHRVLPIEIAQTVQARVAALRGRERRKKLAIGTVAAAAIVMLVAGASYAYLESVANQKAATLAGEVDGLVKEGKLEAARQKMNAAEPRVASHSLVAVAHQALTRSEETHAAQRAAFDAALKSLTGADPAAPLADELLETAKKAAFGRPERLELDEARNRHAARFRQIEDERERRYGERLDEWSSREGSLRAALETSGREAAMASISEVATAALRQEEEQKRFASPSRDRTAELIKRYRRLGALGRWRNEEAELKQSLRTVKPELDESRAFLEAVERYATKSPSDSEVAERAPLLDERKAWLDLMEWNRRCATWRINPVPRDVAPRLAEVEGYLKAHPSSVARPWSEAYRDYLATTAKQSGELRREIDSLLDNPFVSNIWLVTTTGGHRLYTAEKPKNSDAASDLAGVVVEYLVDYEQGKKKANLTRGQIQSVAPAPQTAVAGRLRHLLRVAGTAQWTAAILEAAAVVKEAEGLDPCLAVVMVRKLLKCGREGSPALAETLAGAPFIADLDRVDATFAWMNPASPGAETRRAARSALASLPDLRTLKERTGAVAKAHLASLAAPRPLVGWLERLPSGDFALAEFAERDPKALEDAELGILSVVSKDRPASWRVAGEARNGVAQIRPGVSDLELRPVFAQSRVKPH